MTDKHNAKVRDDVLHEMLRDFYWMCEMCGASGRHNGTEVKCTRCDGIGYLGSKGKFLKRDIHEPSADCIWVNGFQAQSDSLAYKLYMGDVELHELRIAHDNVKELAKRIAALEAERDEAKARHSDLAVVMAEREKALEAKVLVGVEVARLAGEALAAERALAREHVAAASANLTILAAEKRQAEERVAAWEPIIRAVAAEVADFGPEWNTTRAWEALRPEDRPSEAPK